MRLEGTLDAFSLSDIFQLLSYTKKTGTLHLRRGVEHGAVHLRDGEVTGARAEVGRQALGRRLVGAGLVADDLLAGAVEQLIGTPEAGLGRVLAQSAGLDAATVRALATEQAVDGVFDLLRWPEGEFAFIIDEPDPDDLGASLPVEQVVEEGRRRLEIWAGLTAAVPAPDVVVSLVAVPGEPPVLTTDEWQLLSLVDGRRTVADLVSLSGRGDYAIVGALAALVDRGLLQVRDPGSDGGSAMLRRQQLLSALEGRQLPDVPAARPVVARAAPPVLAPAAPPSSSSGGALQPDLLPAPQVVELQPGVEDVLPAPQVVEPQPGVEDLLPAPHTLDPEPGIDRTLLLRLIAGVRAL